MRQWRIWSSTGGHVRWKNSGSEANEASGGHVRFRSDQDSCISKRTQTPKLKGTKIVCKDERVTENRGDLCKAWKTYGNRRRLLGHEDIAGRKRSQDCWKRYASWKNYDANGDSLVKKRSRHTEAMKNLKLNGGPRPVGHIGRTGGWLSSPLLRYIYIYLYLYIYIYIPVSWSFSFYWLWR